MKLESYFLCPKSNEYKLGCVIVKIVINEEYIELEDPFEKNQPNRIQGYLVKGPLIQFTTYLGIVAPTVSNIKHDDVLVLVNCPVKYIITAERIDISIGIISNLSPILRNEYPRFEVPDRICEYNLEQSSK